MSLLDDLGLDPDTVTWQDLASCKGLDKIDINLFYDVYENDDVMARQLDQMCLNCPVLKACYTAGRQNKEEGVWGGVYLSNGNPDRVKNKHKTDAVWKRINDRTE